MRLPNTPRALLCDISCHIVHTFVSELGKLKGSINPQPSKTLGRLVTRILAVEATAKELQGVWERLRDANIRLVVSRSSCRLVLQMLKTSRCIR
jgi:hypothetical protein